MGANLRKEKFQEEHVTGFLRVTNSLAEMLDRTRRKDKHDDSAA